MIAGITNSVINVATSEHPVTQTGNEIFSWSGSIAGGTAAAEWGSSLGPYGALGFVFLGSVVGGFVGEKTFHAVLNSGNNSVKTNLKNAGVSNDEVEWQFTHD